MADNSEKVLLEVQLSTDDVIDKIEKLTKETEDLKKQNEALKDSYTKGNISLGEYTTQLTQNKAAISENNKQVKNLSAEVTALTKKNGEYGTSLDEQRRKLKDMQAAYAAMDGEMRDSEGGEKFLKQVKEQSDAVKKMEAAMGDNRRNVGNYTEALKAAGVGVDGLKNKMLMLMKNPWALLIGAVVTIVKQLADAFKRSEDRMVELKKAASPVQGAIDLMKKGFDALAKVLSTLVIKALDKLMEGMDWVAKKLDALGKFFGKDWGLEAALKQSVAAAETLSAAEDAYNKHHRQFVKEEAALNKEVAELRSKAEEKDKYTAEERLAFLDKAIAKEKQIANERVKIAKERMAMLKADAERGENDAQTNDELAQAEADVTNAEAERYAKTRELQTKRQSFLAEINKKEAENVEETNTEIDTSEEDHLKERQRLREKYGLISDEEHLQAELDALDAAYSEDLRNTEEYLKLKQAIQDKYAKKEQKTDTKVTDDKKANYGEVLSTAKSVTSALESLTESDEETSAEATEKKKAFSLAGVAMEEGNVIASTASSIASAVEGATKAGAATGIAAPFTTPAFIAEMVAIVGSALASTLSSIAEAKNIIAGSFEYGGTIPGSSYHGDHMLVRANSREMIITTNQQKELLDIANGQMSGASMDAQAAMFARAASALPAPVMAYEEFKDFTNRTATYTEIAKV